MLPSYPFITSRTKIFLKLPIIGNYLKKIFIKKTKDTFRGYKLVNKIYGLKYLEQILEELSICPIGIQNDYKKGFLKKSDIEISLRQNILQRIFYDKEKSFNSNFYISIYRKKPLIFPLPSAYIDFLSRRDIKICKFRCLLLWRIIIIIFFVSSIKDSLIFLFHNLRFFISEMYSPKNKKSQIDAYFPCSIMDELPIELNKELKFNIFTYVYEILINTKKNLVFAHDIDINSRKIRPNVSLVFQRYPFHYLTDKASFIKLIVFLIKSFLISPIYFLNDNWWKLFIFSDLFFAKICKMQKLHNFSKLYFFEHSHINRPLWTYIAQEKGSQIYSYYYSGTTSSLVFDNSIPRSPTPMFKNLNWPNYLFWDKYQAKFLKDFCYEPFKFHISGPLCKQIKSLDKSLIRKRSIAVFDISPRRDSLWIKSAQPNVYYTPEHFLPFFEDIIFLCQKYEIQMIIKLKRNFKKSSDLHPSYRNLLSRIRGNKNVLFVHPSTAPYPLINATRCSITMPFTSTPIISSLIKKPVCYYDPNSYVNRLDSEARGLDIIIGVRELENWILRYLD